MSAKTGSNQGNWKIKKINSKSGPLNGTILSTAIRSTLNTSGEAVHLFERDTHKSYSRILTTLVISPKRGSYFRWLDARSLLQGEGDAPTSDKLDQARGVGGGQEDSRSGQHL